MSDQLYETWWYNSSEGGFYYRGRWYATEADLNSAGYYKVYTRGLSLGSTRYALKYQKDLYQLPDGSFKTYEQAHAEGWTERHSVDRVFIRLSDYTILNGYNNYRDGYYVEGVWYDTESDLNTAGYLVGEEEVIIYSTTSFTTYKAIKNQSYGYFIADSSYPSWLSESDLEALGLSLLPYVDINWHLETLWSTGVGHNDRDTVNYNYISIEHLGRRVEYSQLTSLLGTPKLYEEFNVKGAYIGYYREWLHGKAIYLERFQDSDYIASIYRPSLDIPDSDYSNNQPFALVKSKDVEIVKVYSKENLPYNAFKFTKNNTSYYFVLDGEERTWVSSLSSIGFSLAKSSKVLEILADFGDTIYIPNEYSIESFYVQQVYLKLIQSLAETNWYRALFYGKSQVSTKLRFWNFFDRYETNEAILMPWVRVFQPNSFDTSLQCLWGYSYTYEGGSSTPGYRYKYDLNGTDSVYGDYFIQIGANDSAIKQYADYGYPLRIRVGYNTTNNLYDPYFLHLPSNLWSHNQSTGYIDWLEDMTDTNTVSYYYKNDTASQVTSTKRLHIFIKSSSSVEAYHVAIRDNVTREILSAIAYPNHGYFFNGRLYPTEQDLETNGYKLLGQATRILVHIFPSYAGTRNIAPSMPISGMTVSKLPLWDIGSRSRLYKDYDCTTPLLYEDGYDYCVDMVNSSLYRGRNYTDSLYNYTPYTRTSDNTNDQYRLYLITLICNNDNNSPRYPYRDLSDRQICLYQCANQGVKQSEYEIPTLSVLKYQDPYHCDDLETPFIAYDSEKNTYQGVKQNGLYKIPSIDNISRSEEAWLERNIHIKWDIIQCSGNINIHNNYGTEGTTIIGLWNTTTSIIVKENDYIIIDSDKWAHIRFSDDGGSTIKEGWVNVSASGVTYYKDSFEVESDIVILPF